MPPKRNTRANVRENAGDQGSDNQDNYRQNERAIDQSDYEEEEYESTGQGEDQREDPLNQFMNLIRQNLALNQNQQQQQPQALPNTVANSFRAFKSLKPPEFEGTTDPVKARTWLKEMEKAFEILDIQEGQKTIFAAYLLKGEANYWWESKRNLEGAGVISWERFNKLFLDKYSPKYMENQMETRFLALKQDNLTVAEYESRFTELARFVPEFVDSEEKRARRFQLGLKPWIQSRVAAFELTDYASVVQKASIIEAGSEQVQRERENKKRKAESQKGGSLGRNSPSKFNRGQGSSSVRNPRFGRSQSETVNQGNRQTGLSQSNQSRPPVPDCRTCGRKHTGVCRVSEITCYKCGQRGHYSDKCQANSTNPRREFKCFQCGKIGHMAKDCRTSGPTVSRQSGFASNKPPTARTFNMTLKDAARDPEVIAGTLQLNSLNANVLFDSGATKSVISQDFASKLKLKAELLRELLRVEIANQKVIPVRQVYPDCDLEIEGYHSIMKFDCQSENGEVSAKFKLEFDMKIR